MKKPLPSIVCGGHSKHGKDSCRIFMEQAFGIKGCSSSVFALNSFLYERLIDHGILYKTKLEAYKDRHQHNVLYYNEIKAYNTPQLDRLGVALLSEYDAYIGIRDKEEFDCLKASKPDLLTLWVDAEQRKGVELSNSISVSRDDFEFEIDNNGTLLAMYQGVWDLLTAKGFTPVRSIDEAAALAIEIEYNLKNAPAFEERCMATYFDQRDLAHAEQVWDELSALDTDEDRIETDYRHFEAGTPVLDIWHWIERTYPVIIGKYFF